MFFKFESCIMLYFEVMSISILVFSQGFFEGVVGGGAGIRARRWEKEREEREQEKQQKGEEQEEGTEWEKNRRKKKEGRQGES